jgi:hypothetical protein
LSHFPGSNLAKLDSAFVVLQPDIPLRSLQVWLRVQFIQIIAATIRAITSPVKRNSPANISLCPIPKDEIALAQERL